MSRCFTDVEERDDSFLDEECCELNSVPYQVYVAESVDHGRMALEAVSFVERHGIALRRTATIPRITVPMPKITALTMIMYRT